MPQSHPGNIDGGDVNLLVCCFSLTKTMVPFNLLWPFEIICYLDLSTLLVIVDSKAAAPDGSVAELLPNLSEKLSKF